MVRPSSSSPGAADAAAAKGAALRETWGQAVVTRGQSLAIRLLAAGVVLVAAVLGAGWYWDDWSSPRILHAGHVAVAVDRHYWSHDVAGVGYGGTLGLVGGRCVGFVNLGDDGHDLVAVWPAGTTVTGKGVDIVIHSQGRRLRLGDSVDGGSDQIARFPELEGKLPRECQNAELMDFDPAG